MDGLRKHKGNDAVHEADGDMNEKGHDLDTYPSHVDSHRRGSIQDAVFGEITEDGPNYRDVGWIGTVALMMKTQIGLGVLSIPAVFDTLGMIPGVICLLIIAGITTWSDYIVGVFKLRHRAVYGIDDAGQLMFGMVGRSVLGIAFCLCKSIDLIQLPNTLTNTTRRLDLRLWSCYAWYLDRSQRSIRPRSLHGSLRRSSRNHRLLVLKHPNLVQDLVVGLGRCRWHHDCW